MIQSKNGKLFTKGNLVYSRDDRAEFAIARILTCCKLIVFSPAHYNEHTSAHYRQAIELALEMGYQSLCGRYPLMIDLSDDIYINALIAIAEEYSVSSLNVNNPARLRESSVSYFKDKRLMSSIMLEKILLNSDS